MARTIVEVGAEVNLRKAHLRKLKEKATSDEKVRAELATAEERYNRDVRMFTERQQSLPLACEIPVLVEQPVCARPRDPRRTKE